MTVEIKPVTSSKPPFYVVNGEPSGGISTLHYFGGAGILTFWNSYSKPILFHGTEEEVLEKVRRSVKALEGHFADCEADG
jgi:hypothetical protein